MAKSIGSNRAALNSKRLGRRSLRLVADEHDASKWQFQSVARIDCVDLVSGACIAVDRTTAAAVFTHHGQNEILGVHDQARTDQVPIVGISGSPASSLDFEDLKVGVETINLVRDAGLAVLAE